MFPPEISSNFFSKFGGFVDLWRKSSDEIFNSIRSKSGQEFGFSSSRFGIMFSRTRDFKHLRFLTEIVGHSIMLLLLLSFALTNEKPVLRHMICKCSRLGKTLSKKFSNPSMSALPKSSASLKGFSKLQWNDRVSVIGVTFAGTMPMSKSLSRPPISKCCFSRSIMESVSRL